jgi:hypothetical protein
LLVMRDAREAKDPKLAELLQAALKSERFLLASQWFHCIDAASANGVRKRAAAALFQGENAPLLVLSSWDGRQRVELLGSIDQKVTWQKIASVLKHDYAKDPTVHAKELNELLNKFDFLDDKKKELTAQLARTKDEAKAANLRKKLEGFEKEREQLLAAEKKWRDLGLRRDPTADGDKKTE